MYGANLYVTKANQYREVTARLLDYLYTEEWAQIIRGPQLGSEIKGDWDGKGGWYYIDDTQTKYAFEVPEEYSGVYYWRIGAVAPMALRGGLGYSETWMNEVMSDTDTHLRAIYADTWQYTVPCFPQEYSLTQEEADELALISTELKTYVDQMEVKSSWARWTLTRAGTNSRHISSPSAWRITSESTRARTSAIWKSPTIWNKCHFQASRRGAGRLFPVGGRAHRRKT